MRENELSECTDEIVGAVLREMQVTLGRLPERPALLGELSSCVRQVILREPRACSEGWTPPTGMAEELALATYLTIATEGSEVELSPENLVHLSDSLDRTLTAHCRKRDANQERNTHQEVET